MTEETTEEKTKIGLALSGGGFRASFFHIGMLAKLAECDVLRHVEAISCVSGGSIIGTHYYLELRNLLQTKADNDITRQNYIDIVKRLEVDFLKAVQKNLLKLLFSNVVDNLEMLNPKYSRTQRMGELFEEIIYSKVNDDKKRCINDLKVQPYDLNNGDSSPSKHNGQHKAKVPIFIINTTCLNTGHNFQFTATEIGEPPAGINRYVDATYTLKKAPYKQDYRLGYAVAASACVPVAFEPITIDGLYQHDKKDITVRLVDGGVSDNQGTSALLERDENGNVLCNVLLVSDASGQMNVKDKPGKHIKSALSRSYSIFQARLRIAQFRELEALKESGTLKGLLFLHLKKGLETQSIECISTATVTNHTVETGPLTSYGINKKYQECLSNIRTDLDSFSDTEARALMTSGYLMTETMLPKEVKEFSNCHPKREDWIFLKDMEQPLGDTKIDPVLFKKLDEASETLEAKKFLNRAIDLIRGL
ncbi:patatin [Candidatus Magnetobacterium bavaricum]|uniref:Patatin n=1 Tax=Candidatus Magnetobacterium bavaricum TaxID=29290 RepID=A0A0F3GRK5_9BACT|nr:patatin [Candidatus Magnetobacterium bavaricum]